MVRIYAKLTKAQGEIVRKLVEEGYSQTKIASKKHGIGIAKQSISAFIKSEGIGKLSAFAKDVRLLRELDEDKTYKEAVQEVRFGSKWFNKKLKRLSKEGQAREKMKKEWYKVKTGKTDMDDMLNKVLEEEGLISEAGYD